MKLFVYEHITSGALIDQALPNSLSHEGNEMLSAVLHDCDALSQLELIILRDARLSDIAPMENNTRHCCHPISTQTDFQNLWKRCVSDADAILLIAPETNAILTQLQQQAFELNKNVLGCSPQSIALTTHKPKCNQQLDNYNITTPKSCLAINWTEQHFNHSDGYIVKPIDGAGCIDTLLFDSKLELEHYLKQQATKVLEDYFIEAYIKGTSASLSLLMSSDDVEVLAINLQTILRQHNVLTFTGNIINGVKSDILSLSQATELAQQIQRAISGLWGFVGVDIIISDEDIVVVDINPRLTTSYVGLQRSLSLNPMERLFKMKSHGLKALTAITQRQRVNISL